MPAQPRLATTAAQTQAETAAPQRRRRRGGLGEEAAAEVVGDGVKAGLPGPDPVQLRPGQRAARGHARDGSGTGQAATGDGRGGWGGGGVAPPEALPAPAMPDGPSTMEAGGVGVLRGADGAPAPERAHPAARLGPRAGPRRPGPSPLILPSAFRVNTPSN